jgi:hypothetical protein
MSNSTNIMNLPKSVSKWMRAGAEKTKKYDLATDSGKAYVLNVWKTESGYSFNLKNEKKSSVFSLSKEVLSDEDLEYVMRAVQEILDTQ